MHSERAKRGISRLLCLLPMKFTAFPLMLWRTMTILQGIVLDKSARGTRIALGPEPQGKVATKLFKNPIEVITAKSWLMISMTFIINSPKPHPAETTSTLFKQKISTTIL